MNIDFFIEKYSKLVYKICFNMLSDTKDAEDLTQETYLALYSNFGKYSSLPENDIKNIMCKIALNKCKDYLKSGIKKIDNVTSDDPNILMFCKNQNDIEEDIVLNENKEYIRKKISRLKEPYKTIIYEYYINDVSLDKLANMQNVTKATLKTQLYRAKNVLKGQIKKDGGDEFL